MSTTTGPDLSSARQAVEALMDDTCEIWRDAEGTADDVLDQGTGALVRRVADTQLIYTGRCKVRPNSPVRRLELEGAGEISTVDYSGSVPVVAPELREGDRLTITSSRRDSGLVGREFQVRTVLYSTFLVARKMALVLRP